VLSRVARGWTEAQRRAYVIADNQLTLAGEWDEEMLRVELGEIDASGFELDLLGFDADDLAGMMDEDSHGDGNESGEAGQDDTYSKKIVSPIYEPKGEKPPVVDLYDESKTSALIADIDKYDLPDDIAAFLRAAAQRHTVFNFARIAEFYAHADADVQRLMEDSALIIIDFKRAIDLGFVKLTERLGQIADMEGWNDAR